MQVLSYLALGSNLGNRRANLKKALKILKTAEGTRVIKASPVYETEPAGKVRQRDFLNAAVKIRTELEPLALLQLCKNIERSMKRKKTVKWGPRVIDVDILFYGKKRITSKKLTIPHKELSRREFVLRPLIDLAPEGRHAVTGKTFKSLLKALAGKKKIRKVWRKI